MKIALILASTMMLASAQYFDQIAMESGVENSPQYAAYVPVQQQQQVVYQQQPQQYYYSQSQPTAQQTYTVPLQGQAYVAPPVQILSQQNYVSQSETPTVVNIPSQVRQISQYSSAPVVNTYSAPVQETYAAPVTQTYAAPVTQTYAAPVTQTYATPVTQTYATPVVETVRTQPAIVRLRENSAAPESTPIVRLRENYAAPEVVDTYVNENTYSAPAAPVVSVQETYSPPAVTKVVSNQISYKQPTVLKEVTTEYGAPEQFVKTSGYDAPIPQFIETENIAKVSSGYGPPGYTPPAVVETYIPTAKMTDQYYGAPAQDDIVRISQSLISEPPVESYGPPEEIRQVYGIPEEPKEHRHIYVHAAPQESYTPKVRILQPINQHPEKQYQIIFVRAPSPIVPVRTEIQLPPPPVSKTLVYVLTKAAENNHEIKISGPAPTKPSKPEVYFIRYAANAQSSAYGAPPIVPVPAGHSVIKPPRVSYTSPGSLDVYAPEMSHSSYSTTSSGYFKREVVKEAAKEEENQKSIDVKVADTNESKSSGE